MPALVEIEVVRRDLEKEVVGRRIKDVEVRSSRNAMKVIPRHGRRKDFEALLEGAKFEKVDRAGKWIVLTLDNEHSMLLYLGDTGLLVKTSASDPVETHTHIVIGFTIGGQLRLIDPKADAEVYIAPEADLADMDELRTGGAIDPLEHQVTWHHFSSLLEEREQPMKDLLMDENFVIGLGDICRRDPVDVGAALRPSLGQAEFAGCPPPLPGIDRDLAGCLEGARHHVGGQWVPGPARRPGAVPARAQSLGTRGRALSALSHTDHQGAVSRRIHLPLPPMPIVNIRREPRGR